MANNIEFVILGDAKDLEKKLSGVKKGFDTLAKTGTIALAGLTASAYGFIEAARIQEQAINQLNQALKNQGNFSEAASKDLQNYASALQEVSLFGDETIIKAQALIASFGFEGQVLKDLTKSTLDLAQAKGIDLASAADIVAKSVGGTTNVLGRYGIVVDGVAGSSERAKSAIEGINKLYGGQAEAATKGLGATIVLKNALSDLAENVGTALTPSILDLTAKIKAFVDFVKANPELTNMAAQAITTGIQLSALALAVGVVGKAVIELNVALVALKGNLALILPLATAVGTAFAGWKLTEAVNATFDLVEANDALTRGLKIQEETERASLAARGQTLTQVQVDATMKLRAVQEQTAAVLEAETIKRDAYKQTSEYIASLDSQLKQIALASTQQDIDALILKFQAERDALINHSEIKLEILRNNGITEGEEYQKILDEKAAAQAEYDGLEVIAKQQQQSKLSALDQKGLEIARKVNADKVGSLKTTLEQAAQLNSKFAIAYKAVAIGEAIMSTAAGVAHALKDYPFPANIAIGALVAAAGATQISTIASQSFAVGTPSLPSDMVANVHKKEMIVPATFSEAINRGELTLSGPNQGGATGGVTYVFDFSGAELNGVTDSYIKEVFTKASENIRQGTLTPLPA